MEASSAAPRHLRNPSRFLAWSAVLGGLGVFFAGPVVSGINQTRLYPSVAHIDLGSIKHGTIVHAKARFWNPGLRTLSIQALSSSCGCTAATVGRKTIPPLSSIDVNIDLDTYALENEFAKNIQVEITPMGELPAQIELRGRVHD